MPRYFEKDYPLTPELLDPRSAAEKIIAAKATGRPLNDMPFIADRGYEMSRYTPGIEQAIQERNWNRAVDLLTQAIRSEQDFVREESQRL